MSNTLADFFVSLGFSFDDASFKEALGKVRSFSQTAQKIISSASSNKLPIDTNVKSASPNATALPKLDTQNTNNAALGLKDVNTQLDIVGQKQSVFSQLTSALAQIPPLLQSINTTLQQIAASLDQLGPKAKTNFEIILGYLNDFNNIKSITNTIKAATAEIYAMTIAVLGLDIACEANPFGPILSIIGIILAGVVVLVRDFIAYLEGSTDTLVGWGSIIEVIKGVFFGLIEAIKGVFFGLIEFIKDAFCGLVDGASALITILTNKLQPIFDTIIAYISLIIKNFKLMISAVIALFSGDFSKVGKIIGEMFRNVINFIETLFPGLIDNFCSLWNTLPGWFSSLFSGIVNTILDFFIGLWGNIKSAFPNFAQMAEGAFTALSSAFSRAKDFILGIWNSIEAAFSNIIKGIKDKIMGVIGPIAKAAQKVFGGSDSDYNLDGAKEFKAAAQINNFARAAALLAPSPMQAANSTSNHQQSTTINQNSNITINESQQPHKTAKEIKGINDQSARYAQRNAKTNAH